jgi:hypothetical protein
VKSESLERDDRRALIVVQRICRLRVAERRGVRLVEQIEVQRREARRRAGDAVRR